MTQNGMYDVFSQLKEDYDRFTREGYDLFGIFLFGSQNYGLNHNRSDIDAYAVYFSTTKENAEQTTYFRAQENGNIHPISVNTFLLGLKLQEKKALEIIFTPFYYVAPQYQELYQKVKDKRNEIARARPNENLKRLLAYSQRELENARKYRTDSMKRVANVKRVLYLAEKYIEGQIYERCLTPTRAECEELLFIKTKFNWSVDKQISVMEQAVSRLEYLICQWEAPPDDLSSLEEVQGYFNERII